MKKIGMNVLGIAAAAACAAALAGGTALAQQGAQPGHKEKAPGEHAQGEKHSDQAKHQAKEATVHIGDTAPDFKLTDTEGKEHALADLTKAGKIVVLVWFNPDCPFVKKHFENGNNTFETMVNKLKGKDVVVLAINSGAKGNQGAGVERNKKAIKDWKITIPVLMDESGATGKAYGAKNTPATYVVGKDGKLAYMGALDDDNTAKKPGSNNYALKAVEELLAGKGVTTAETQPYGCSVKYSN